MRGNIKKKKPYKSSIEKTYQSVPNTMVMSVQIFYSAI